MSFINSGVAVFTSTFPSPVTGFIATNPTQTSIDLRWNRSSAATLYSIVSSPPTYTSTTSGTSVTFYSLSADTEYTFTITPSNVNGNGSPTTSAPIRTIPYPTPVPNAVTNFTVMNPQETTVDLTWDPALYASSYSVESSPYTSTATTGDTALLPYGGLTPDTEYTFTITPSNVTGNGPPTTSDPVRTLLPYPDYAPVIYNTPVAVTTTTIEFAWPDYTPQYAASYKVYCHDPVTYAVLYVQTCPLTPHYYTFTGLQTNCSYQFNLSSVNARGEQQISTTGSTTMYTVPTVTGVAVSNPTETTVDVTWDTPGGNMGLNEFLWVITTTPETTTQQASGTTIYTFTGLTPDTSYTFTVTPQVGIDLLAGDPVTSGPISTLLPLPSNGNNITVSNPTATSFDLSWDPSDYATTYELYETIYSLGPISVSGTTYTWAGLTPDTYYSFYLIPVNATGSGLQSTPTTAEKTLIQVNLAYTGTIETLELRPGNYTFEIAGGSGPQRAPFYGGGRCFAEYTLNYTVTSTITIQYAIGQASPGDVGGAGGTYIYDQTNSQWLFIAGGAGTNNFSPNPADTDPGDGSGGAAGSGGGSGAGVNSNGSDSTVSAGYGGLTYGNGCTGGAGGDFGSAQTGGFGGGGGGTRVYDPDLPGSYGQYAYYTGGGGGYTGGTTTTAYDPGNYAVWSSGFGTSYMITGATVVSSQTQQGYAPVTNGYININP